MRAILVLCLAVLAGCGSPPEAQSSGDVVSWTNPTTRTDGSPLTNLDHVLIQWGAKGGPYNAGQMSVPSPATTVTVPRAAGSGTVCYVGTAVDANGLSSAPSNEACKTVVANPSPLTGLAVK